MDYMAYAGTGRKGASKGIAILNRVIWKGLMKKGTSEQRPEGHT